MHYYNKSALVVLKELKTSEYGLHPTDVEERRKLYGLNITDIKDTPLWRKLLEPFIDVFMLVLFVAALISFFQGNTLDAVIIVVIMAINVIIYYVQRFSTDRILRSLRQHSEQLVEVLRDGKISRINASDLVPGDIINLLEGEKIPADARLISGSNVRIDESLLTGESVPISKTTEALIGQKEIYEQSNILFQGSFVVAGTATAVVTATGNNTEFGQIAALSKNVDTASPVQQKINKLIRQIVIVVALVAILAFALAILRGTELVEALRFVLALSVSAVPEGLPVAISVILVLGMRRMAAKKALVRNMRSIETVGVMTTIATDKTGTLTKNKLTVQDTWQPKGTKTKLAEIIQKSTNQDSTVTHDPLDIAMIEYVKNQKNQKITRTPTYVLPFDQAFAMSGNIWRLKDGSYDLTVKGAPEQLLARTRMSSGQQEKIEQTLHHLTAQGYRVVALARTKLAEPIKTFEDLPPKAIFNFGGFIAVADVLRREARGAIATATESGVVVRMITGDHFETAFQIGKQLGMVQNRDQVFDSRRMNSMTDDELDEAIRDVRVFSRVIPENKYRILSVLKRHNIAAMTGDGVNDVPALVNAHVGVAMGSGSQIAKDASDIILLDNNFKSIIVAMREGRTIIANIRRMLYYLLATNTGEVLTMLGSLVLGLPVPLVPVQILWINLVTDSALVIPLGLEPGEKNLMKQKPKAPNAPILNRFIVSRMILVAVSMATTVIALYAIFDARYGHEYGRTIAFSALAVMQWANACNARSDHESFFKRLKVLNWSFIIGLIIAIGMQILAFGPLRDILHVSPVSIVDLLVTGSIAFVTPFILVEIHKHIGRRLHKEV